MSHVLFKELSESVVGAAYYVHNSLGLGLLEKVYEGAMVIELRHLGLKVEQQVRYPVSYRGEPVGDYFADLVVEQKIILELKAVKELTGVMEAQLINYLRLSGIPVGYLMNFRNARVEYKRRIVGSPLQ